ncbi:MAG TPA: M48 family metallopeptidase [Thermoanaerobaculia bacterium]|jgi:predicted Zn-dependent protease|nr:M48 family metallopeptidase [Thermoanaerobaculia bacterium]
MYKRNTSLAAVALAALLAISCGSSGGGAGDFNLISIEEEWQLGQQLSQDVARQVRLSNDSTLNSYVSNMGQRIVAQTPAPFNQLPWHFHVVDDPAINAFAIPGGHIYVHTGLIANADNAAELAGVMAHEISHVTARHTTEQITRQYGLSVLAGLVLGQDPGALAQIAAQIVAGGALARFSRAAEEEADELGIRAMAAAGYNPIGMATMFEELLEHRQGQPGRVEQFFSTHPLTEERARNARQRAEQIGDRGTLDEPGFQAARARVT